MDSVKKAPQLKRALSSSFAISACVGGIIGLAYPACGTDHLGVRGITIIWCAAGLKHSANYRSLHGYYGCQSFDCLTICRTGCGSRMASIA